MDIFEQIKKIISPSNIKTTPQVTSNTQRGLDAVSQIRSSLNLPQATKPSPIPNFDVTRYSPNIPRPTGVDTTRFEARVPAPTPQPQMSVRPRVTPSQVMSVRPPEPKAVPFQTFTPRVPEAETPFGRFIVNKGVLPLETGRQKISTAWENTDNKGGLERALTGLEGVGLIASIPNELFIQPIYDSVKLAYKANRTGRVTEQDINDYLLSSGGEKGTLFDALGFQEEDFKNQYGNVAYQTARFFDFAPELVNVPGFQAGEIGQTTKFAREVKLGKGALEEAGKVDDAIKAFEKESGTVLNKAEKESIKKATQNPKQFLSKIEKPVGEITGGVPPSGNIPKFVEEGFVVPTKERKFPITVKDAEGTAKEVKNILKDRIDIYNPIKNKDEFAKATKFVQDNEIDNVIDYIKYAEDPREVSYIGQALMKKLQDEGNFARVVDVLDIVAEQGTKSGQAIQALSVWGRLTPEGALKTAQNIVRKYNSDNKLVEGVTGFVKLTENKAKEITNQAKLIAKTTDDTQRLIEISKLQNLIAKVTPTALGEKISAIQTLAQLLNPKTFVRNVLGNAIFGTIDSLTQTFATPLDLAISLFTKKRTIAPASLERQFVGGYEGFKLGLKEALAGADTSNLSSQFDLPKASVFDSKIMQGLEKALNVTLKAPDRAFYQATYADTLAGLMKLNKTNKPTKEMIEIAHYEGLRRTFQDENAISKFFQSQKQSWNRLGIKGFGLGDLILKYPKTPANLLVRSAEYTPLGYASALFELAKPLMGQAFDQRAFVNNIARATVGTGIINLGYALAKQGIITPRPNSDTDARNAQDLQGLKSYSFNVSALKRYVLSGLDQEASKPQVGDQLFSYDWAQPAVLPLAMGANIAENDGKIKDGSFADKVMLSFGPLASEIINSSDTLTEQPLLQGLKTLYQKRNIQEGLIDAVVSSAGSFVPTLLNQINQYTDNVSRETYSPDYFQSAYNKFSARIPLLAQKLPARSDVLGRTKERFPNASNTFFNVFFNPAFTDQIKADPVLSEVISIYEDTGEKTQFPRVVQKSIKVNGENLLLDTQQLVDYQRNLGELSNTLISDAIRNPEYQRLSTTEKAVFIGNLLSDANKITKIKLFNDNATKLSGREELLLNNDTQNYLDVTIKNKQDQLKREADKAMGITKAKITKAKKTKLTGRKKSLPRPKKLKLAIKTPKIKKIKQKKFKPVKLKKTTKLV